MAEDRDVHEPGRHALLLAFDTDAPEFARGFEAGRVWANGRSSWLHLLSGPAMPSMA